MVPLQNTCSMTEPIVSKGNRLFELETARQRVVSLFFISPNEEFSLTDISHKSNVSKSTASRVVLALASERVVTVLDNKLVWRIKADTSSSSYFHEKIPFNMRALYCSNIVNYLIERFRNPKAIVVFGSFRTGQDVTHSDIDIAIETNEEKTYVALRDASFAKLENVMKRRIQLHVFNRKDVDFNLFNSIANGIVLYGFLEVKP